MVTCLFKEGLKINERFTVNTNDIGEIIVTDVESGRVYRYDNPANFFGLIRIMNEQQATISTLKEENEQLRKQVAEYEMILRQHEFAEKEGFK